MQIAIPRTQHRASPPLSRIVAAIAAVLMLAAAGYFLYQRLNPAPAPVAQQTAPATRGSLTASVNATGTAAATTTSRLGFSATGRVADVQVSVGDAVTAGQFIARLDTSDLDLAVRQAQASLTAAQAKLQQVLDGARPEDVAIAQASLASAQARLSGMQQGAPADIAAAQAAVQAAQSKLAVMQGGSRPEEIASAQASLESAQAKLDQVLAGATSADLVAAQTALDSAQANLESSQIKLAEVQSGPTTADLVAAQSTVDTAQSNLQSAQSEARRPAQPVPGRLGCSADRRADRADQPQYVAGAARAAAQPGVRGR
jgi:HlyD family secretion protein